MTYYCFTNVANVYSKINLGIMKDDNRDFKDNHADFIEKLWVDLEIDKEKCECHTCIHNESFFNCARIIPQIKINSPIRTCRICQKDIPKEEYEGGKWVKGKGFVDSHLEACAYAHGVILGVCNCEKCKNKKGNNK